MSDILDLSRWTCKDCRKEFVLTDREVQFYSEKVEQDPKNWKFPRRCKPCRRNRA